MEVNTALEVFAALSQESRLWAFRILVQAGPAGLCAGDIADALGSRQNTMSSHLKRLNACGLIEGRRDGRHVIYNANYNTVSSLVFFLLEDCCAGNAGACDSVAKSGHNNPDLANTLVTFNR